jgi:hypothetical protein
MEDFGLDLTLDEAAEARIAHADFVTHVKNWSLETTEVIEPFVEVLKVIVDNNRNPDEFKAVQLAFPIGVKLLYEKMNELYNKIQDEAVKVLGAPFELHDDHHPACNGTKDSPCGHQDHWKEGNN